MITTTSTPASRPCRPAAPHVYRRRRLAVAGVSVLLVASLFGLAGRATATLDPSGSSATAGVEYVVQPGDTLWTIVQRVRPDADPRPLVHDLSDQLGGVALQAGDRLVLPAES